MKYLLIAALLLAFAAFAAFGKLIGSGVGPAEDERRAKWQGKRKPALDEDPDIQGSMHAASEEPTKEA